jgi:hypothetical protein
VSNRGYSDSELSKDVIYPVLLCKLALDTPVRVWNGCKPFYWNNEEYSGLGEFGGISQIEESENTEANGIELSLSGIPPEYIAICLNGKYRNKHCYLWLGLVDYQLNILQEPKRIFSGYIDGMKHNLSGTTASLSVKVESKMIDLQRKKELRYTDQCQKSLYPTDKGLKYVASLSNKKLEWKG